MGRASNITLALMEGTTKNAAVGQALIDNLIERGLDPAVPRLFIIDGSKALSRAIRRSFGREMAIRRCQIHKARNIMEQLPKKRGTTGSAAAPVTRCRKFRRGSFMVPSKNPFTGTSYQHVAPAARAFCPRRGVCSWH
jgi:hypothetical protein